MFKGDLEGDLEGDLKGYLKGDLNGGFEVDFEVDLEGDFRGDFKQDFKHDLEGDLLSSSGQLRSRSGLVKVWFSLQVKFSSFELDSEVGRLVELYCHFEFRLYVILRTRLTLFLLLMLEMASLLSTSIGFVMPSSILSSFLAG